MKKSFFLYPTADGDIVLSGYPSWVRPPISTRSEFIRSSSMNAPARASGKNLSTSILLTSYPTNVGLRFPFRLPARNRNSSQSISRPGGDGKINLSGGAATPPN